MKHITTLLLAVLLLTTATKAQDPISNALQRQFRNATIPAYSSGGVLPVGINQTTGQLEQITDTNSYLKGKSIISFYETASTRNYSTTGKSFIKLTASRLDTVQLIRTAYTANQLIDIVCTNSANDSTVIIPSAGNINGAATYWFNGTYKAGKFLFDGTNFFILNKQ